MIAFGLPEVDQAIEGMRNNRAMTGAALSDADIRRQTFSRLKGEDDRKKAFSELVSNQMYSAMKPAPMPNVPFQAPSFPKPSLGQPGPFEGGPTGAVPSESSGMYSGAFNMPAVPGMPTMTLTDLVKLAHQSGNYEMAMTYSKEINDLLTKYMGLPPMQQAASAGILKQLIGPGIEEYLKGSMANGGNWVDSMIYNYTDPNSGTSYTLTPEASGAGIKSLGSAPTFGAVEHAERFKSGLRLWEQGNQSILDINKNKAISEIEQGIGGGKLYDREIPYY